MSQLVKRVLSPSLYYELHMGYTRLRYSGGRRYCPACRSSVSRFLPAGLAGRPDARCPVCRSVERHRLTALFLRGWTDLFTRPGARLLHVAPEPVLQRLFREGPGLRYVSTDLFEQGVMLRMDLTHAGLALASFDAVYCSHVLEHIPDDGAAMRELAALLTPEGWALIQVPITDPLTFEDPTVTDPAERLRVFGQSDHVRRYGRDFGARLAAAGLHVLEVPSKAVAPADQIARMRLDAAESIFFCTRGPNAASARVRAMLDQAASSAR